MGYKTYTCPIARECGGCEWLAVPYPIQLERKQAAIEELFSEASAADGAPIDAILGMDEPQAYRHKAAAAFGPRGKGLVSGFFKPGTHRIVPCETCLVEQPALRELLDDLSYLLDELGVPPYIEDARKGLVRHAIARAGWATGEILLTIVVNGDALPHAASIVERLTAAYPELVGIVLNENRRATNAMLGDRSRVLWGRAELRDELLGCKFEIGPASFYQTNPAQTEPLYRLAIEGAGLERGMRLLDAYCGCGTIGICAARMVEGLEVVGVEKGSEAVGRARANARINGLESSCRFVCADATDWIVAAAGKGERFDAAVLDPPRAGSTPEFLEALADLAPARVSYVSCNPKTQVRDIALLRERGYRLERVSPVDMFPHTKHVETVVLMARK